MIRANRGRHLVPKIFARVSCELYIATVGRRWDRHREHREGGTRENRESAVSETISVCFMSPRLRVIHAV
jgi:hypothetical protein